MYNLSNSELIFISNFLIKIFENYKDDTDYDQVKGLITRCLVNRYVMQNISKEEYDNIVESITHD